MALDEHQLVALRLVLQACADECTHSPLGNLLEGNLKVAAADALLLAGYSILESANIKDQGRVLSLQNGQLKAELASRPVLKAFEDSGKITMSPDLRVWAPCRLVLELQVRSCFGSQSALFSENLFDDIRRVGTSVVDAFVLAADRPIYDALRGVKQGARGRKAKYAHILPLLLPPSESLATAVDSIPWSARKIEHFEVAGVLLWTSFNVERCVVGWWRAG